jgi:hypothetical protein
VVSAVLVGFLLDFLLLGPQLTPIIMFAFKTERLERGRKGGVSHDSSFYQIKKSFPRSPATPGRPLLTSHLPELVIWLPHLQGTLRRPVFKEKVVEQYFLF